MPSQGSEAFLDRFKYLFSSPSKFFEKIQGEGIQNSLLTYVITLVFAQVTGVLQSLFFFGYYSSFSFNPLNLYGNMFDMFGYSGNASIYSLITVPVGITITLVALFAYTGVTLILVKVFKGKGGYAESFKVVAYSLTPYNIISIVPFVGGLSLFYSFFLMVLGVRKLHNLSTGKAVAVVLLPIFALLALFVAFIILILFSLGRVL